MENGAASPGRWQVRQCFCRIGATSFVKVGGGLFGSCPRNWPEQQSTAAITMATLEIPFRITSIFHHLPRESLCRQELIETLRSIITIAVAVMGRRHQRELREAKAPKDARHHAGSYW